MKVLLYEPMHQAGTELLKQRCEVMVAPGTTEQEILGCAGDADAIIIRANGGVTARIMDAAPKLKVIGRHGVGMDTIDVAEATRRGIWVVNTPEANLEAVAEHTVGMLIVLAKRMREADSALRRGNWQVRYELMGVELGGKTIGIVGLGNIGSRVAVICSRAFKMQVLYYDIKRRPKLEEGLGARPCELEELFRKSDFISIHLPKLPETEHLVGAKLIALMKPAAYIINTSRGGIVDEKALADALHQGKIAGAGLDVFEEEFKTDKLPFFEMENVILTPHMAAHTEEAMVRMSLVAEDVIRVLDGKAPLHPVNKVG